VTSFVTADTSHALTTAKLAGVHAGRAAAPSLDTLRISYSSSPSPTHSLGR